MFQSRLVDAMNELDNIQAMIRQAKIDPSILHGTSLDLDESDACADLIDEALNKLESALQMLAG